MNALLSGDEDEMTIDAEWALAVLRVVQATNVVMVHSPSATACCSVRDLDISSLQSRLMLSTESWVAVFNELARHECEEHLIEVDRFIWSVLHMHNASFCPNCGCELCMRQIKETKLATCLALVRTPTDAPSFLAPILEVGACWAIIHAREVPIIPAPFTLGCLTQQSSISANLLLTTLTRQSRVYSDTIHEFIQEFIQKRGREMFI
jgi:hypothetical protein